MHNKLCESAMGTEPVHTVPAAIEDTTPAFLLSAEADLGFLF